MATGFTAGVVDGTVTSFKDFATRCAKAFGFLYHMRDMPFNAKIFYRKPDPMYKEQLQEAKQELKKVKAYSTEQVIESIQEHYPSVESFTSHQLREKEHNALIRKRIEDMQIQVNNWEVPSLELVDMKSFMLKQLKETLAFDVLDNREDSLPQKPPTPKKYHKILIKEAEADLKKAQKEYERDIQQCEEANKLIDLFLKSLK